MKILLKIIFMSLMLTSYSLAENIFRCDVKDGSSKIEYLIKVDNEDVTLNRALSDLNAQTGEYDTSSEIYGFINKGEVIKFVNGKSEVFKLIVFNNAKIKDDYYFRAIYIKNTNGYTEVHTIRIASWEPNASIIIYSNYDNKLLKGNCK